MTSIMIASLVTAMAAVVLRLGRRRRVVPKPAPVAVPAVSPPSLSCPVCSDRHPAAARRLGES